MPDLPMRDEGERLFVHRDDFQNMRVTRTRPIGYACTEYVRVKVRAALKGGAKPDEDTSAPPAKKVAAKKAAPAKKPKGASRG